MLERTSRAKVQLLEIKGEGMTNRKAVSDQIEALTKRAESDQSEITRLRAELTGSKAETAAAIHFLETEMGWENFRVEFGIGKAHVSQSKQNAEMLAAYLKETGHGLKLLAELDRVTGERDALRELAKNCRIQVEEIDAAICGMRTMVDSINRALATPQPSVPAPDLSQPERGDAQEGPKCELLDGTGRAQ